MSNIFAVNRSWGTFSIHSWLFQIGSIPTLEVIMMRLASRLLTILAAMLLFPIAAYCDGNFIDSFSAVATVGSTIPLNGDVNPYGVVVVPADSGNLVKDDILISNFNASSNEQGTGSTIVQITPGGTLSLFAQISDNTCTGGVGLTTALAIVQNDLVVVGSLPTMDGTSATAKAGCLIVLDNTGTVVDTFTSAQINGPWDMTAVDVSSSKSLLFVTNVLNGTVAAGGKVVDKGTVLRLTLEFPKGTPKITQHTIIAEGFAERTDPAALVVGPTGVGLGADGTLYVADTLASRIAAIPKATTRGGSAGVGTTIAQGGPLFAPLGLVVAPDGDILTVNANDGNIVDTALDGDQAIINLDSTSAPPADPGAGTLFGLAVAPGGIGVYFVDDGSNTLNLLQ
jgi:hypothetical protein